MMEVRTPRMPAAPRVGRSGRGLGLGLQRLRRRVERAHDAVYAWICKPIMRAGRGPGLRLQQLAPMAYPVQHQWLVPSEDRLPGDRCALLGWVEEIGRQLSERSCATASAVAGSLSEDVLARLLLSDTLANATRVFEAAPRRPPSPQSPLTEGSSAPSPTM
jgi:hypothetical protein